MYRATIAAVLALALAHQSGLPQRPTITVSAAVSLTDVLTAAADDYGRAGGGNIRFNFAASNVLARQIVAGAPVDLFVSADEAQMDVVEKGGALAGPRVALVDNQLAVVVPSDRARMFRGITDLADPAIKRIAVGDPDAVPAGVYARQYLEKVGLWTTIQPKLVPSASVRAALSAVETGAADAGIVYRTDARTSLRATVAWVVPRSDGPRIVYPAAVVRGAAQPAEATRFLDYLRSAAGRRTWERFGFTPVS